MAPTDRAPEAVCDAGPVIHLDELGALDLLSDFARVLLPDPVREEVTRHHPDALLRLSDNVTPVAERVLDAPTFIALAQTLSLGAGEQTAISWAWERRGAILLTDDAAARLAAESLGIRVHGTLAL
jgi:predicted nucleic acid-binding protein